MFDEHKLVSNLVDIYFVKVLLNENDEFNSVFNLCAYGWTVYLLSKFDLLYSFEFNLEHSVGYTWTWFSTLIFFNSNVFTFRKRSSRIGAWQRPLPTDPTPYTKQQQGEEQGAQARYIVDGVCIQVAIYIARYRS